MNMTTISFLSGLVLAANAVVLPNALQKSDDADAAYIERVSGVNQDDLDDDRQYKAAQAKHANEFIRDNRSDL